MTAGIRNLFRPLRSLDNNGNVAVEYALTFPYLVAFLYGIIEVCHFAYIQTTIANIAHDAVRYATVHSNVSSQPLVQSDIVSYVNSELSGLGFKTSGQSGTVVTVTYSPDSSPGSIVKVLISYPFTPFMAGFNAIPGSSAKFTSLAGPIAGSAQMVVDP